MNHPTNPEPTMSSREIADLTGKRHDNVKRDVKSMLSELKEDTLKFEGTYLDAANRLQTEYLLDRELTETLLTGYSAVLRRKVVARWRELEQVTAEPAQDMHAALNDPSVLRGTLLTYTEKVIKLEGAVKTLTEERDAAAPKLAQLDRIARSDGSLCIRDSAKSLQIQEKKLKQLLIQEKWAYRRPTGSGLLAYSDKIQAGLMEHKVSIGEKSDGSEWTGTQARITPKGLVKLAELLAPMPPPASANQGSLPLH